MSKTCSEAVVIDFQSPILVQHDRRSIEEGYSQRISRSVRFNRQQYVQSNQTHAIHSGCPTTIIYSAATTTLKPSSREKRGNSNSTSLLKKSFEPCHVESQSGIKKNLWRWTGWHFELESGASCGMTMEMVFFWCVVHFQGLLSFPIP